MQNVKSSRVVLRSAAAGLVAVVVLVGSLAPVARAQGRAVGTVVIANGWSAADSAVASALAALESDRGSAAVVLHATSTELTERTAGFLEARTPSRAILVGGTAALSPAVEADVKRLLGAAPARIEGRDRFDTAAKAVPGNADTFIVANGYSPADTGVAAALAAVSPNAAVLLATADSLTEPTARVLRERKPRRVEFVGGTKVLAKQLADRVRELVPSITNVHRHEGDSRTHTAAAAAPDAAATLVVANGWSPADTAVAAALAAITPNAAVLYATRTSLGSPSGDRIAALQPSAVVLIGGNKALSTALHRTVHCLAPGAAISRASGDDRIDTAVRAATGALTPVTTDFNCGTGRSSGGASGGGGGSFGGGGGGGGGGSPGGSPGTPAPATQSSPPQALRVAAKNNGLAVRWTAPANDGGANITDYDVQYRACEATGGDASVLTCDASPTWGSWTDRADETTSDTATSDTVSGLTNGTAYQVRVRAANRSHESEWTASEQATPAKQPPDAPDEASSTLNGDELVVKWNEPADNGGKEVDGYDVRYRTRGSSAASWPNTWFSYHHSGDSTQASFQIASGAGGSAGGARAASAVAASVPSPPVSPNAPQAQAQSSGTRAQSQQLQFQAQVRARNSLGAGAWSPLPPNAPTGLTLAARHASLQATWSPATENGSAVTGYNVRHRRCTATDKTCVQSPNWGGWTNDDNAIMSTTGTIVSLVNGTAYQVQVRATSAAGNSDWSQAATKTPAAAKPDAPAAPTLAAKNTELDVQWTAPAGNGASITDYDVRYRACTATPLTCTSSPAWRSWTTLSGNDDPGSSTSAAITGLTNGTKHQVQVRATNSVGTGQWSTSSNGTPASSGSSGSGPPDAPAAPTVTAHHQSLRVAWTPPAVNGSPINDYDVAYRACTNANDLTCASNTTWGSWTEWKASVTSTGTTATIVGLANGTKHQVRVRAGSSAGNSGWSASTSATPDAQAPSAPAAPSLTSLNGSLGVSWTAPLSNGAPISDYDVQYRACTATDSDTSVLTCATNPTWANTWVTLSGNADPGSATSATIAGLTNDTAYQVQVSAENSAGPGGVVGSRHRQPGR